ncbi:uncharacterized protein BT62DRAFT_1007618 [Guyanagaster necrorhizus]|uniref:Uncharacterized protein n=1 Tax=Guyanagaster necrorhizus TaxID=856835 RepID=A0A9P7VPR1_9AGAR|nr:uncharacterized protein BT62DRAFT_1007618 [Guyanagaster necrorhizus MCA 3950]KAG7444609.1 hypothetical protein BT62DRAFT_1007618 [Guyanagaster necrorhizus MCA 3950]
MYETNQSISLSTNPSHCVNSQSRQALSDTNSKATLSACFHLQHVVASRLPATSLSNCFVLTVLIYFANRTSQRRHTSFPITFDHHTSPRARISGLRHIDDDEKDADSTRKTLKAELNEIKG